MTGSGLLRTPLRLLGALAAIAMVSGCETAPHPIPTVIDSSAVTVVQNEVKRQVHAYNQTVSYYLLHPEQDPWKPAGAVYACGSGQIDFAITSIKIDLVTSVDVTDKASISATLPLTPVTSIGPSASTSQEVTNLEELTYTEWAGEPNIASAPLTIPDLKNAPVAQALLSLRGGLVASSMANGKGGVQECFLDYDPDKTSDSPHSFQIGVVVVNDPQVGLTLKLGILNVGGSVESKSTGKNTLTVSFRQLSTAKVTPAGAPAPAPDGSTTQASSCPPLTSKSQICINGKVYDINAAGAGMLDYRLPSNVYVPMSSKPQEAPQ